MRCSRGVARSPSRHMTSASREKPQVALEALEAMPPEIVATTQQLLRELLKAKLPGTLETDIKKAGVGVYLATHVYGPPEDRECLLRELVPHDARDRRRRATQLHRRATGRRTRRPLGDARRNASPLLIPNGRVDP